MSSIVLKKEFIVSPAPHLHTGASISKNMYLLILALLPAAIFSISVFGMHAVRVMALAVSSAMASEWAIQKLFKRPVTIDDGNALYIGLLLALLIPPSVPWWFVVVGCFVTILIGKQLFGGIGYSPLNPVLVGLAILAISWKDYLNFNIAMVNYDLPYSYLYPLSQLKSAGVSAISDYKYMDLFMGKQIGGLGATPVFLILIGGIFLMLRGTINWIIPVSFLAGTFVTAWLFNMMDSTKYAEPLFHILAGNVMIGAFFLATDYSSSPVNRIAMILFGVGCGVFTIVFRAWSIYPDGVVFSILIMNLLNPLLDKIKPKVPGKPKS